MDSVGPARYSDLDFNAPMSPARAHDLITTLGPLTGASVVDLCLECGYRLLALSTGAGYAESGRTLGPAIGVADRRVNVNKESRGLRRI